MNAERRACRKLFAVVALLAVMAPAAYAADRTDAARNAAQNDEDCKKIGDFYWEIGDVNGVLANGSIGTEYNANTEMKLASASKFVWGAYVLQKLGSKQPTAEQLSFLEMRSGYTKLNPFLCLFSKTSDDCLKKRDNGEQVSSDVGRFHYSGGHDQKLAQILGLGGDNAQQFTNEVMGYIGRDIKLSYAQPSPAGGMQGTPSAYGAFLRKILAGKLRMHDFLGADPVCTKCSTASYSPAPWAWHYSINHWVEDDPNGDGAFSSPGLMGFYPWISADKKTYGLVARQKLSKSAYVDSAVCGRDIRKAWMSASN
ncbi:hypothetical protein [Solimonas marina]|uniref:Beta-lactamase n=1 Tax=Solimonas marina TaxID=2714601 RepID=A0A969W8F7_9GAMM|nr:hypothetical protein [Solimonas marina]NKF22547.1 hypothetical protein [Solimonas marina]